MVTKELQRLEEQEQLRTAPAVKEWRPLRRSKKSGPTNVTPKKKKRKK